MLEYARAKFKVFINVSLVSSDFLEHSLHLSMSWVSLLNCVALGLFHNPLLAEACEEVSICKLKHTNYNPENHCFSSIYDAVIPEFNVNFIAVIYEWLQHDLKLRKKTR